MEYRRFGNTIYLRLDPKEEILEEIGKVAKKENIRLAQVTGLGAINDFTAGVYNTVTKECDCHGRRKQPGHDGTRLFSHTCSSLFL